MIKDALQYILGLNEPVMKEIHGDTYSDKIMNRIAPYVPRASAIRMHTLTSLVDYIKANIDTMAEKMIIEVKSPTEVSLYSQLDDDRKREILVNVEARIPDFQFNSFVDQENFIINLQSKFIDCEDRALVLQFAGTVEAGTIAEYGDNGVMQKATIKTGLASKKEDIIPNPVSLKPYRTFLEVEQPTSSFVFRMKQGKNDGVACAIFEADGGAWMAAATKNIKEYLEHELADMPQFIVIS